METGKVKARVMRRLVLEVNARQVVDVTRLTGSVYMGYAASWQAEWHPLDERR